MTTAVNPFDHVLSELRIKPDDMPKMSTPSNPPSYQSVRDFQKALNHNAMNIHSFQTKMGHLALVVKEDVFLAANNQVKFNPPTDPGLAPTNPTNATTSTSGVTTRSNSPEDNNFVAMESIRAFTFHQLAYQKYVAAETALRNLILNSIEDKYINELEDDNTGYNDVSPLKLMTHIWDNYATIDDADHTINEENMRRQWAPPQPIEDLFEQLKKGQRFAKKGNETIHDTQLVRWGYQNIRNTGLFDRACEKWRKKEKKDKSWDEFKKHFRLAEDDRRKNESTASPSSAPTYTANQVQQIFRDELANLLTQEPTESDPTPSTTATENSSLSTAPPASANAALTAEDIRRIVSETIATQTTPTTTNNGRWGNSGNRPPRPPLVAQGLLRGKPVSYCWTHGVTSNLRHTSATCRRKATGHKDDATFNDRKGGAESSLVPDT